MDSLRLRAVPCLVGEKQEWIRTVVEQSRPVPDAPGTCRLGARHPAIARASPHPAHRGAGESRASPGATLAGVETGCDSRAVAGIRRSVGPPERSTGGQSATVSNISEYFEKLVSSLSEKARPRRQDRSPEPAAFRRSAHRPARDRAARPPVRGRPDRYRELQVVQRHLRPPGGRSDHRTGVASDPSAYPRPRSRRERAGCRFRQRARALWRR